MTKKQFIRGYVRRCRSVGFILKATPTGCVYLPDPEVGEPGCELFAAPCDCGCEEGWGMFDAPAVSDVARSSRTAA